MKDLIKIGTISSIDETQMTARVNFFDISESLSGPLKIIDNMPKVEQTQNLQEPIEQPQENNENNSVLQVNINTKIKSWKPKIGQMVLCVFLPSSDEGDGYILGGV